MVGRHGFSLVELSIVLVILGLLVGGVMSGQSLIKAAELRSVTSEFQQYQAATNVFREKYRALPGDMPNARAFWNDEGNCAAVESNSHTDALSGGTCDGDGNGVIGGVSSASYEQFLFWQHLQLAGLLSGTYSGVRGPAAIGDYLVGENCPRAKYRQGGWVARTLPGVLDGSSWFKHSYGNHFTLGAETSGNRPHAALFTPEDAWNIDTKVDDGMPGTGKMVIHLGAGGGSCSTATANDDYDAEYELTITSAACTIAFREAF